MSLDGRARALRALPPLLRPAPALVLRGALQPLLLASHVCDSMSPLLQDCEWRTVPEPGPAVARRSITVFGFPVDVTEAGFLQAVVPVNVERDATHTPSVPLMALVVHSREDQPHGAAGALSEAVVTDNPLFQQAH